MVEKNTDFDKIVERRNTNSLKYDFAERLGRPKDALPLWVADMDFQTSSLVLDELQRRVAHGIFGYTEPGDSYYEAVAGWMADRHGLDIERRWIVKTPGVVYALAMAVKAFSEKGDAVLIQQPVYYPFAGVINDNQREVISNDLVLGTDGKYHMDFEDFERKIVENRIRLFLLCSPHNPVSRVWTAEELSQLADICLRHHVIIVSDEIHEDFTFEGFRHTPLLNVDERLKEISVTCTSPGKTFNLASLQISNILIPNGSLRAAFKKQVAASGYSNPAIMGMAACEAAYRYGGTWYEALTRYLQGNLAFVRTYLQAELPGIRLIEPEGTYLLWLDFRGFGLSESELEDRIVNKAGLWLDGGTMFGKSGAGFQRINIATSRSVLREALDRLKTIFG